MAQQRGMKRAEKVLKRKQKAMRLKHAANVRREERGYVAPPAAQQHDHAHGEEGHDHDHEHEEKKPAKKKAAKKTEE